MLKKRPSPSMVVAIIALVFALVGTAIGSVATISALSKKEKKQTRGIADSEVSKLAPGLSVKHAGTADSAASAGTADSAASATTLGGLPPSAFVSADTVMTSGLVKFSTGTRTLVSKGPLSITARCDPGPSIVVDANTTETGTRLFLGDGNSAGGVTPGTVTQLFGTSVTDAIDFSEVAPSGASITGYVAAGANLLGSTCAALAYGIG
jgi:hypothetical protein